jgi:hypothetical protein
MGDTSTKALTSFNKITSPRVPHSSYSNLDQLLLISGGIHVPANASGATER